MSDLNKVKKMLMVDISQTISFGGYKGYEIEEESLGSLFDVGGGAYILAYDTKVEDEKVTNTIKIQGNSLSIVRLGKTHVIESLELNQSSISKYLYGGKCLVLKNFTKFLEYCLTPNGGIIELNYSISDRWDCISHHSLELFIR